MCKHDELISPVSRTEDLVKMLKQQMAGFFTLSKQSDCSCCITHELVLHSVAFSC